MKGQPLRPLSAGDVLARIRAEIDAPSRGETAFARRMAHIQSLQTAFRKDPVGGRLAPLKRAVYWFTASAFDRQAKVIEALLEVIDDLGQENERLREILQHSSSDTSAPIDSFDGAIEGCDD